MRGNADNMKQRVAEAWLLVTTVLGGLWTGTRAVLRAVWTVLSVVFNALGAVFSVLGPLFRLLDALTGGSGSSGSSRTESDSGGSFS